MTTPTAQVSDTTLEVSFPSINGGNDYIFVSLGFSSPDGRDAEVTLLSSHSKRVRVEDVHVSLQEIVRIAGQTARCTTAAISSAALPGLKKLMGVWSEL